MIIIQEILQEIANSNIIIWMIIILIIINGANGHDIQ
jgi:hypothetical protein